MPSTDSNSSGGRLRILKIPACLASIKNITLPFVGSFAVTVAVTTTSNRPSSMGVLWVFSCISSVGFSRSKKMLGALGLSSDKSFTYSFSMLNRGCCSVVAASLIALSLTLILTIQ